MQFRNVFEIKGTAVILVTGRNDHGTPGFVAMNVKNGKVFSNFGRALGTVEADETIKKFAAWKKSIGPHVMVELNRGTASLYFLEELALPADAGKSTIDLLNMLMTMSIVTDETLDMKARLADESGGLVGQARHLAIVYRELDTMYKHVAQVFGAAREIQRVMRTQQSVS